jgi:hypothetical protein
MVKQKAFLKAAAIICRNNAPLFRLGFAAYSCWAWRFYCWL